MITIWLDAHLDPEVAPWIGSRFEVIVKHLVDVGLDDAGDEVVFEAARRFRVDAIITKDKDLPNLVARLGPPPRIVWLRIGNTSSLALRTKLLAVLGETLDRLAVGEPMIEIR